MSYWVIKRGDEYLQANSGAFRPNRESAVRFFEMPTHLAEDERRVFLRTRPPSDRLYLAARLAAWEPVVREVEKMSQQWTNGLGIFDRVMGVIDAYMRVPKEHRP